MSIEVMMVKEEPVTLVKQEAVEARASEDSQSELYEEDDMMHDLLSPEIIQHSGSSLEIPAPRSLAPSSAQLDGLIRFMANKRSLAVGHARTTLARNRSRDAWREIADFLNSDGCGCVKTWEQWSKYWRDKKGSVKRKVAAISIFRQNIGSAENDETPELTEADKKILAIMGGDSNLEIDPFKALDSDIDDINGSQSFYQNGRLHNVDNSESTLQLDDSPTIGTPQLVVSYLSETAQRTVVTPRQVLTSRDVSSRVTRSQTDSRTGADSSRTMPESDVRLNGVNSTATSGQMSRVMRIPRRRLLQQLPRGSVRPVRLMQHPPASTARQRRLLQPAPRVQRRPRSSPDREPSFTERLIAIEEQRAKAELSFAQAQEYYARSQEAITRSQEAIARGQEGIVQAIKQLTDAVIALVNK